MSENISEIKNHVSGLMHGATVNKIKNFYHVCERAHNAVRSNIKPVELMRDNTLSQTVHDDIDVYSVPSDFGEIIDLAPQADRGSYDQALRRLAREFAQKRNVENKRISIEGREGTKILRINYRKNGPKTFHNMNSLTANGTWSVVVTAANLVADELVKWSGSAAIRFDVVASGDGIQNTTATVLDLTEWDEVADIILPFYLESTTNFTGVTGLWGNDLTTAYWTGVAQTAQADGSAWQTGWNVVRIPWSTATETGTVAPATVDSFRLTVQSTGAVSNIRVDNILFSLGTSFMIKYYSRYGFKNTAGTYLQRPTLDTDETVYDETSLLIFIYELAKASAQQIEGNDSVFDLNFINGELGNPVLGTGLYGRFLSEHPSQAMKAAGRWSSGPRYRI